MSATKRITLCAILTALSLLLGYIESVLPPLIPLYGIKVGFSNLPVLYMLFTADARYAYFIGILKSVLSGMLFADVMSIPYSLFGIVLALLCMQFVKKIKVFSIYGVSTAGSAMFQVGQIIVACAVLQSYAPLYYVSYLLLASVPCGMISAGVVSMIQNRIRIEEFKV